MDILSQYKAFVRAIELGNFSLVAKELELSQSAVSKQVASLEADIGVQLFARTTRKITPTEEAIELYPFVIQLLQALANIQSSDDADKNLNITGTLRLSIPNTFARKKILPLIPKFIEMYPRVNLDIRLTNSTTKVDLIEEGIDLAIHIGELPPSTLMARSLGIVQTKLIATPEYLSRHGRPMYPSDLSEHQCLILTENLLNDRWVFESEQGREVINVKGPFRANDLQAIYDATLQHLGIGQIPDWVIESDLAEGRVEWILQDYFSVPIPIRFIFPQTRFLSLRARYFIDFMIEELTNKKAG